MKREENQRIAYFSAWIILLLATWIYGDIANNRATEIVLSFLIVLTALHSFYFGMLCSPAKIREENK